MEKLLTRFEVEELSGLSCSSLYRLMRSGQFPEPIKIAPRAVRWRQSELDVWLSSRPRATGQAAGPQRKGPARKCRGDVNPSRGSTAA